MSDTPNIRLLLARVADPESPEDRDEAWDEIAALAVRAERLERIEQAATLVVMAYPSPNVSTPQTDIDRRVRDLRDAISAFPAAVVGDEPKEQQDA